MASTTTHPTPRLVTAAYVSDALAVSRRQVYRLGENGTLRSVRVGRAVRFDQASVDALLSGATR